MQDEDEDSREDFEFFFVKIEKKNMFVFQKSEAWSREYLIKSIKIMEKVEQLHDILEFFLKILK